MRPAEQLTDDGAVIFLFHGVINGSPWSVRNYTRKHLPASEFSAFLDGCFAAGGTPLGMPALVEALAGEAPLPPRAFAVTFDDGFENNATVAAPVLAAKAVPATFYVTSDFIDRGDASWTDRMEAAFERAAVVVLHLEDLAIDATAETAAEKRALADRLRAVVKARADVDPYDVAADIERQTASSFAPDPALDAKMTWDQLRVLAGNPLFTVGGHGRTHRVLAFLDDRALRDEIGTSVRRLADELRRPLRHYSYPEGLANCYSDRVIEELRAHGIVCAPTAEPGVNHAGDDPFRLKRVMVA